MTKHEITHFLVVADPAKTEADVRDLGTDYEAAIAVYNDAEETHRNDAIEVVLLSADSVDTIRRTHSSYFESSPADAIETLLLAGAN